MDIRKTKLPGTLIIEPKVFGDERGFFLETWHAGRYRDVGIAETFVQDNVSYSSQGVLRGLHFQSPHGQGKLVQVIQGEVYDVAVDIRKGSPTFGEWVGVTLEEKKKTQFYVPPGFAHGFCVLSETAMFSYKCTDFYHPDCEHSIAWNDPDIGIAWPIDEPQLSSKDATARMLRDLSDAILPVY